MSFDQIVTIVALVVQLVFVLVFVCMSVFYKNLPPDVQKEVDKAASFAVPAVEQAAQKASMSSSEKFDTAAKMVIEILGSIGLHGVSPTLIKAAIEASVFGLNQAIKSVQSAQKAEPAPNTPPSA